MDVKIKSITYGIGMGGNYGKIKVEMTDYYEDLDDDDIEQFELCKANGDSLDETFASYFERNYEAWITDVEYEEVEEEKEIS